MTINAVVGKITVYQIPGRTNARMVNNSPSPNNNQPPIRLDPTHDRLLLKIRPVL